MKLLTANEIIAAPDLPQVTVEVPEWGGSVIVRALSAHDREWFESQMLVEEMVTGEDGKPKTVRRVDVVGGRAKLLSRALVDENGNALFDESQMVALGKKSNAVINRLFAKAQELSGVGQAAVDEAEKN